MNQFPGTNFHDLNLDWLLDEMKNCLAEWAQTRDDWEQLVSSNAAFKEAIESEWAEVQAYITHYFDNLDLTQEVSAKINALVADGTIQAMIVNSGEITTAVGAWLGEHVDPDTGYVIDDTLQISDAAADAKVVGKYVDALYLIGENIGGNVVYHDQVTPFNTSPIDGHIWFSQLGNRITIHRTLSTSGSATTIVISGTNVVLPTYPTENSSLSLISGHTYVAYRRYVSGSATNGVYVSFRKNSDGTSVGTNISMGADNYYDPYKSQATVYTHDSNNGDIVLTVGIRRTSTGNTLVDYVTDVYVIDVTDQIAFLNNSGLLEDAPNVWTNLIYTEGTHTITIPYTGEDRNIIFKIRAGYTQAEGVTDVPKLRIYCGSGLNLTGPFTPGSAGYPCMNEYRMVRWPGDETPVTAQFTVPAGVTLTVERFEFEYDDRVARVTDGVRINGHRKLYMTPQDTEPGAVMAARAGMVSMIEIPKRLSDGTWIFYHDDSLVYNDTYIRQADGTQLPSEYDHVDWSDISSEEAFSWDWGVSTSSAFAGLKPMTMNVFFGICAKTGMMPMLSIHPFPTTEELQEIRACAIKYGVLGKLGLKCSVARIADLYSVFGNDVESYTIDVTSGTQSEATVLAACAAMNALNIQGPRKVIELFKSTVWNAYFGSTQYDAFGDIINAGLECSLANQAGQYNPESNPSNSSIISEEHFQWYIDHGCHEFTYEHNFCNGLNW